MKKIAMAVLAFTVSCTGYVMADPATPAASAPASVPAAPAAKAVRVEKIAVGTGIDNKDVSGEAAQFPASVSRVYCWVKVSADQVPVTLKHVWTADGKQEAEVPLEIKYASMRTWSSKSVWPGAWKVTVVDDQGTELASKEFTVSKESVPSTPAAPAAPQVGQ